MTGETKSDLEALDRLADFLVDDILSTPDDELRAETTGGVGSRGVLARLALTQALATVGEHDLTTPAAGAPDHSEDQGWSSATLAAVLTGADSGLTAVLTRLPLASRNLRTEFASIRTRLVESGRAVLLPELAAAASATTITERHYPGGVIRLAPVVARPGQMFLIISSTDGTSEPACVTAEAADGTIAFALRIEAGAVDGHMQMTLDTTIPDDAVMVRLLQDPKSVVTITWRV